ncbi:hypothetical protein FGB62_187g23 [Gracilaria domingensis]|nr:hypothetical protein FGB62_187g23 [Gracilaria domingensis]
MVNVVFLHPNTFNVLKYVIFSLTIGCSADIVVNTLVRQNASRTLLKKGRYCPAYSPLRLCTSRSNGCPLSLFATVFIAAALEIALDYSTGATSIPTTSTQTFLVSKQVSNVSQLIAHANSDYIVQLRHALQRVEGTCFNIYDQWYSPVFFNVSGSVDFYNLGEAALCPQNMSRKIDASSLIEQSSFSAAHILQTNIWNRSQLAIGRDTHSEEDRVAFDQVGDVEIGALEKYSFIAVNFSHHETISGSEKPLTGNTSGNNPWAWETVLYRTSSGVPLECLTAANWIRNKQTGEWNGKTITLYACLVPITGNRSVLALYDEVTGKEGERSLVMSVALEGVTTFHDLRVLKAMVFLHGRNNRMHTNRELAILTVLCSRMIMALSMEGLQNVRMEVDGDLVTVPTWTLWGIVLFFAGLVALISLKVAATRLGRDIKLRGDLVSAKGIAEHWRSQEERCGGACEGYGRVVLVAKKVRDADWAVVGVQRGQTKRNDAQSMEG